MTREALNALTPGTNIVLSGRVLYSHVAELLEGDELENFNSKRKYPITRPCTALYLSNVELHSLTPHPENDPDNSITARDTLLAQYIRHQLHSWRRLPERGLCFEIIDRSQRLPAIFEYSDNCEDPAEQRRELTAGTPVHIVLTVTDIGEDPKYRIINLTEIHIEREEP